MLGLPKREHEINSDTKIPSLRVVVIRSDPGGLASAHAVPRSVSFTIEYHQVSAEQKRIIAAYITTSNFSEDLIVNDYSLTVNTVSCDFEITAHFV